MKKGLAIAFAALLLAGVLVWPRARTTWALSNARVAVQAKDCPGVLSALDGVSAGGVDGQFVHEARAYCLLQSKEWQRVHDEASASLAIAPGSVQALQLRFIAARELGRDADAEADLGRLIAVEPNGLTWREARAELRAERRAWEAAIEDADAVLALDPKHDGALDIRMHAWHALGNWENAYRDVVALLEVKPSVVRYRDAADLAIPLSRLDDADGYMAAALAEAPDDLELNILACRLRVAHTEAPDAGPAETDAALRECERTAKRAPGHAPTHRRYGRMLLQRGELQLALAEADAAVAIRPSSALAHKLRADVLLAQQKPAEAVAAAQEGLTAAATDDEVVAGAAEAGILQTRAAALLALKRDDEARADLEKALTLLPEDDTDVAAVKQKLSALRRSKR